MDTNVLESVATQDFTITIAKQSDVVEAFYITKVVLANLLKNNIIHQDLFTDFYQSLKKHAEKQSLYILKKKDVSLGMMTFDEEEPSELKNIKWGADEKPGFYISRIFVLPYWRGRGLGSQLLAFAEEIAKERGHTSVKLDISSGFEAGNMLLMKNNYRFTGNVFFDFQKCPFNCYVKNI
jgi:GNAT superfamily N-acetyltransferase